ncbi:hypothetical protein ACTFIV_007341 [Dictyostelium citrinum]
MKLLFFILQIFSINLVFSEYDNVVLTPFKDSNCSEFGGGVGYGYMPMVPYSNLIRVFGNLYDTIEFTAPSNENLISVKVLGSNQKPITTEIFTLGSCQFSNYFNVYYLADVNIDLPKPSLQFNVWATGSSSGSSVAEPCSVDLYQSFSFVSNGTIIPYDDVSQQFTCIDGNPFLTSCKKNNSCKTTILNTCFDGDYQAILFSSKNETILLTPYKDSECTEFGGGVGYGYMPQVPTSNIIRVFGNLYDTFEFKESSNGQTLLMNILGSNGKILKTESFNIKKCQYSQFLKAYYLFDIDVDLPTPSLQFNQWGNSPTTGDNSFNGECTVDIYESFNFIANNTIINLQYIQSTQQFYCINDSPYSKTCQENSSCYTNQLTSCFDGEYKATCVN